MKIMIINGVNLNMLGIREKGIYGNNSYSDLVEYIKEKCNGLDVELEFRQSNFEGEIVNYIHECYFNNYDGIVINPAAFTHYSYAIADAIAGVNINTVEVHISDIYSREEFRHHSVTANYCKAQISGQGFDGYVMAVEMLLNNDFKNIKR